MINAERLIAENGFLDAFFTKGVRKLSIGCLEWPLKPKPNGYGYFSVRRGGVSLKIYAHRFSYIATNGPIPDGLLVCHECDNRICYEPSHLFAGTQKVNMNDAKFKGRVRSGEGHRDAKLSIDDIHAIRADGRTYEQIAFAYEITSSSVSNIKSLKEWASVPLVADVQKVRLGERIRGESQYGARLTEAGVRAIRLRPESNAVLAAEYSVSEFAIYAARKRLTWKHVE